MDDASGNVLLIVLPHGVLTVCLLHGVHGLFGAVLLPLVVAGALAAHVMPGDAELHGVLVHLDAGFLQHVAHGVGKDVCAGDVSAAMRGLAFFMDFLDIHVVVHHLHAEGAALGFVLRQGLRVCRRRHGGVGGMLLVQLLRDVRHGFAQGGAQRLLHERKFSGEGHWIRKTFAREGADVHGIEPHLRLELA